MIIFHVSTDYGFDMSGGIQVSTAEVCCALCTTLPQCAFWTFRTLDDSGLCYSKFANANLSAEHAVGFISGTSGPKAPTFVPTTVSSVSPTVPTSSKSPMAPTWPTHAPSSSPTALVGPDTTCGPTVANTDCEFAALASTQFGSLTYFCCIFC